MKEVVSCLAFRIMSGVCSCSYSLWFLLGKSAQAASTGAFLPKSRTQRLTYFAPPAPVPSEPGLSSPFHLQPVWAVWLRSLPPLSEGCVGDGGRGRQSGLYLTGATLWNTFAHSIAQLSSGKPSNTWLCCPTWFCSRVSLM